MNLEAYKEKLKELDKEFEKKRLSVMMDYVNSNNPYKIGDKITDHVGSIIIEKTGYDWGFSNNPCATYYGIELLKNGTPNKKGNKRWVYQSNIEQV